MLSEMPWCADCVEPVLFGGPSDTYKFASNCDNCDDLIGVTDDDGMLYRNNRPGRKKTLFTPNDGTETTVAYLQRDKKTLEDYKKDAERIVAMAEGRNLPQATGPDDVGNVGTDIAVAADVVPTSFVNYKRPVASPKMVVEVPFETETGVVMPPLPKHECELPKAVETELDKWGEKKNSRDIVLIKDGSVFTCACGKNWFVRVHKVPYHISDYDPQYIYSWKPIRWFNFGRIMDLRNRKEQ